MRWRARRDLVRARAMGLGLELDLGALQSDVDLEERLHLVGGRG